MMGASAIGGSSPAGIRLRFPAGGFPLVLACANRIRYNYKIEVLTVVRSVITKMAAGAAVRFGAAPQHMIKEAMLWKTREW